MRVRVGILAVVAALAACGGGDEGEGESAKRDAPYLAADGPLHAPVLATENGQPTNAYSPAESEANAFVTLGEGAPSSTLVVTWYRVRGDEREELFAHEIEVGGAGRARSQAVARGGLPPGIYETVATLGDRRTRTPWLVTEGARETRRLSAATTAGTSGSAIEAGESSFDDDDWDTPGTPAPPDDGRCHPTTGANALVQLYVRAGWNDACERLTIAASVTGPPETLLTVVPAEAVNDVGVPQHSLSVSTDMCAIPGGSDLPGTVVKAVVTDSSGAAATAEHVLPDLGEAIQAGLEATPAAGAAVRAGDRIQLHALALLMSPSLGVETLYVNANDELVEATGNLSGRRTPVACDLRRLLAQLRTEYRVPDNPPSLIEICANAKGFDGTVAEPDCARFYTGEVWEGTWDAGFHVIGSCTPAVWPQVGTLQATVAADGSLSGRGDLVNHIGVCGGVDVPREVPVTPLFTGRLTEDEIRLEIQLPGLGTRTIPMARAGDVAEGSVTVPLGGGSRWEIRARLECMTC